MPPRNPLLPLRLASRELPSRTNRRSLIPARPTRRNSRGLPKYYTIKAVAEALDVSPRTVRRWIANGDLIAHRSGGVVRIADSDLRAFLTAHRDV